MRYEIEQGNKDWRPIDGKQIMCVCPFKVGVKPDNSMIFNYVDNGVVDPDWADWKKIKGASMAGYWPPSKLANLVINTQDAIMLTWRWNIKLNCFEFCLYTHVNGSTIKYERADQLIRVPYREDNNYGWSWLEVVPAGRKFYSYLTGPDGIRGARMLTEFSFTPKLYSTIGMYYGGANNSPGKWGGAAPKDMSCEAKFET